MNLMLNNNFYLVMILILSKNIFCKFDFSLAFDCSLHEFLVLRKDLVRKFGPCRLHHIMCFQVFSKVSVLLIKVRLGKVRFKEWLVVRVRVLEGKSPPWGLEKMTKTFENT